MKSSERSNIRTSERRLSSGQVVVIMLMVAMVIGVVIPMLVYMLQHEMKWTVKETKSTRAFHLAEAGLDRGVYKLLETGVWDDVIEGTHITGYYGDIEYFDLEIGYYKIKISTGEEEDKVIIIASGKDKETDECRTIQAVYYSPPGVSGALTAAGISGGGNFTIHWGPMSSVTGDLQLTGSANNLYPRKYARGHIYCNTAAHSHDSPASEGTAETSGPAGVDDEYKEWHDQYAVPDLPDIDFDEYETDARNGGVYISTVVVTWSLNGINNNVFTTYYVECGESYQGSCEIKLCNAVGVLIIKGSLTFSASNTGANYDAMPPADAWKEYQVGTPKISGPDTTGPDTLAGDDEWYGDDVNHTVKPYTIVKPAFRGFIYADKGCSGAGNPTIYGALVVKGTVAAGSAVTIFYDKTCAENVKTTSTIRPTRLTWRELPPQWDTLP